MTDAQAARIKELRMQGKGYRAVAEALGLTRDIKSFMKSNTGRVFST